MKVNPSAKRRGASLIAAVVALAVVTVLLSVMTLQVVAQRERMQQRERQLQADWLTRAGMEWAAARLLEKSAGFNDEKRDFAPDATVQVTVEKAGKDSYTVTVAARVGQERGIVERTRQGTFRRSEEGKSVRLQAIPSS